MKRVYIITDLHDGPPNARPQVADPYTALASALGRMAAVAIVAVPILATMALLVGILLGWPLAALAVVAILALPVLVNLVDLLGSRLGWPSLSWVSVQIRRKGES